MKQKSSKKYAKLLKKQNILSLAQSLEKNETKGWILKTNFHTYISNLFDPFTVKYLILYIFENTEKIKLSKFVNILKKLQIREQKSEEIQTVLKRVKLHFTENQILIDDIFPLLSKGKDCLHSNDLKKSLDDLKIILTYEEFEKFLFAFDLDSKGYLNPYNFTYVLKKLKNDDNFNKIPEEISQIDDENSPIALSPKQHRKHQHGDIIKCITVEDYIKKANFQKTCSRPKTQASPNRPTTGRPTFGRTASATTRFGTIMGHRRGKTCEELILERMNLYSKKFTPQLQTATFGNAVSEQIRKICETPIKMEGNSPKERISSAKNLLLSTSPRGQSRQATSQGRSLGTWLYANPGKEFEKLGRIEIDGAVQIKCETKDGFWLKVQCGKHEGWVPSIKIDRVVHRRMYSQYDEKRVLIKGRILVKIISMVTLRNAPNWGANSLLNLKVNEEVRVISYLNDKSWIEIQTKRENGKPLNGWVPFDSVESFNMQEQNTNAILSLNNCSTVGGILKNTNNNSTRNVTLFTRKSVSVVAPETQKVKIMSDSWKGFQEKLDRKAHERAKMRRSLNILFNYKMCKAFKKWKKYIKP